MKTPNLWNSAESHEDLIEADELSQLLLKFDSKSESYIRTRFEGKEKKLEILLKNFVFEKPSFGLSQSKIKTYWSVIDGEICPKAFLATLNGERVELMKTSDAMVHGQIFEYRATGQKNYWNEIPDESILYGRNDSEKKVSVIIDSQVKLWKHFVRQNKLTRLESGKKISFANDKFNLTATPDVFGKIGSTPTYIDLKFADPNSNFGKFAWTDKKLIRNEYLLLQVEQVLLIHYLNTGEKADFIFYIASKNSETEAKARKIEFKEFENKMNELTVYFESVYYALCFCIENGIFAPIAEVKNCELCSLKCDARNSIPEIKTLLI